jgi:glycosyltransferase involved in cell wall biosynthesis
VPEGDVRALARALIEMIGDSELRRSCAAGALETVSAYSLEAIGARWEELISQV